MAKRARQVRSQWQARREGGFHVSRDDRLLAKAPLSRFLSQGILLNGERSEPFVSETNPPRRIGRSIAAVLIGIVAGIIFTLGTDIVLHAIHVFPPWGASMAGFEGALLLATAYRAVYGVMGSYIIAPLAPDPPILHPYLRRFLRPALCLVGAAVASNKG